MAGLILGGVAAVPFTTFPPQTLDYDLWVYALAGAIAGFGSAMGNGALTSLYYPLAMRSLESALQLSAASPPN